MPRDLMPSQILDVLVFTNNDIEQAIRSSARMADTDYCILQTLLMLGRSAGMSEYHDFLLLKRNTVSMAISRLWTAGYVSKELDANDLRKCTIAITEEGIAAAHRASVAIREALLKDFWTTFEDERVNWGMVVDSRAFLLNGGGGVLFDADPSSEDFVVPTWIIALKHIEQLWTAAAREGADLSLSQFRVLDLLDHLAHDGACPAPAMDIASTLRIEDSTMSRIMRSLRSEGLIETAQSSGDRRSFLSEITPAGTERLGRARKAIGAKAVEYYSVLPPEDSERLSAWHYDMLRNRLGQ